MKLHIVLSIGVLLFFTHTCTAEEEVNSYDYYGYGGMDGDLLDLYNYILGDYDNGSGQDNETDSTAETPTEEVHEHEEEEALPEYTSLLEKYSGTESGMTLEVFERFVESLVINIQCPNCGECDQASAIYNAVGAGEVMTEKEFEKASLLITYYLTKGFGLICNQTDGLVSIKEAQDALFPTTFVCKAEFAKIKEMVKSQGCAEIDYCYSYLFLIAGEQNSKCVEVESGHPFVRFMYTMANCKCNLPKKDSFLRALMGYMKDSTTGIVTLEGFGSLLDNLGIGSAVLLEREEDDHSGHDHHNHKRSIEDSKENFSLSQCYSGRELADIFSVDADNGITEEDFMNMCPAIVQQIYSGSCHTFADEEDHNEEPTLSNYGDAQRYGYATASVTIISMLAFIGMLMFPAIGTPGYKLTMQFFIALGVGTLSGDALLHIIPEVLGIHKHEPGHDHSDHEEDKTYIWKLLVVVGGIYFFFLFENSIRLWNTIFKTNISLHVHENGQEHHHHINGDESPHQNGRRLSHYITDIPLKDVVSDPNLENKTPEESNDKATFSKRDDKEYVCFNMTSIGIMVLIGDVLHNFGDGLAIGVAFSSSWMSGIGTSIAIFCHELPHEFGDFAIYLNNGMTKWQALLANFIAACFAYIGCYIGLKIAEDEGARSWMMAIIAGMFLYIALVDVLHEMLEEQCDRPIAQFILQNFGLLLGWAILLLIAYYEDKILSVAI